MRSLLTIICISLFLGGMNKVQAQDIIITSDHDSLQAKVLKITEKVTSYKLESYLDGPTYELSNGRIQKIIYKNGEEFTFDNGSPQGAPIFDQHKNNIEWVASEIAMLRGSMAYSRFIGKYFEVRIGGSISLVDVTRSYGHNFLNYGELQFNYHPLSFRKLDYYIGLRGRIGNARTYSYEPYYYYNNYYYTSIMTNKVVGSVGLINGVRLNFTQRFGINMALSLDAYMVESRGAVEPTVGGIFGVGFKF